MVAVAGDADTAGVCPSPLTTVAEVWVAAGDDTVQVTTTTATKDCMVAAAYSVGVADNYGEGCDTADDEQAPQRRTLGNFGSEASAGEDDDLSDSDSFTGKESETAKI